MSEADSTADQYAHKLPLGEFVGADEEGEVSIMERRLTALGEA